MFESLKGWIIDPNTQAQKTIENYENQRLSIEDAIESGLLNNRAGQIFLDYGDVIMGPPVTLPSSLVGIREAIKGKFDSKEMQRTATAGFYAGFVGQGIEYTQIISKADYQLSMIITSAKGVNSINNPLSYLLFIKDFSLTQTIDAAKAGLQDVWNGTYDSAIGRKIGAGTFNYLLMTIGGAQLKGKGTACKAVGSGSNTTATERRNSPGVVEGNGRNTSKMMYGTDKNAGVIPKEIADKLREKQYNNFDGFRNDFWKAVAETDYANEFLINGDPKNYYRMKNGGAPLVVSNQAINGSFTYQLHHIIPINQGGSVYSVDNLVVVTPRYHAEILIPEVHGYNGFKQFFR